MGAGGQANTFIGALTQGLQGFAGGRLGRRADIQEQAGLASADAALRSSPVTAALTGGDLPQVPGAIQPPSPVAGAFQGAADPVMQPQGDMAESIRMGLIQRGLPAHVADAFVLNFQDESGLNPGINEQNPIVEGSRGGFGLAQWTGPRRRALEEFAAQRGTPVSDLDTQLDFLMTELQGPEAGAAEAILSAPDTGSAAQAIVNRFLRPAEEHRARRAAEYAQFGGGMPASVASAPTQAPSNVVASILAAQQNPWVAERYGPVLDALVEQDMQRQNAAFEAQLAQSDPMYQAQLQAQQLQNQALMNPPAPEPVFQGGQWWDISSGQPQPLTEAQAEQTAAQQNYEFLVSQGLDPQTAMDRAFSGGTTVNVGGQQDPTWGDAPKDTVWLRDEAGNVITEPDPSGRGVRPVSVPISGTEADIAMRAAEGEQGKTVAQADQMLASIDGILNDPALESATGILSGLQAVPGTPQYRFGTRARQLQGQAFLQAFESLKGAGQITEIEGQKAAEAIGRLDTAQRAEDYREALNELRDVIAAARSRAASLGERATASDSEGWQDMGNGIRIRRRN